MRRAKAGRQDSMEPILAQWRRERPDLDLELIGINGRVLRLAAHLDQRLNAVAEATGLSRALLDVLAALRRSGAPFRMSPTELFSSMMVTSGCMTHRLDRLESEGLVERLRDPEDRRGVLVGLTPKGRTLIDSLMPQLAAALGGLSQELEPRERRQFADLLRRVLGAFESKTAG
jgi:DNA-binding MarR family transcriptional regulator